MIPNVFFLSYSETNADGNWAELQKLAPRGRRVHGIEGVKKAHQEIARQATTDFFFIVDGDNLVDKSFDFTTPRSLEKNTLYVWRANNPVNDLCYGFGAIKLYSKWLLLENPKITTVDIATSIAPIYMPIPIVASTTHFNASPLESWRGAFRETAKLTLCLISNPKDFMTQNRLMCWLEKGAERTYGAYCLAGAKAGHLFAKKYSDNTDELLRINDFNWLSSRYKELSLNSESSFCLDLDADKPPSGLPNI
jgi:hypothetical protein